MPPELAGLRLDHFIKTQIPRLSRTKIQDIIATQLARDDDRAAPVKAAAIVAAGDRFIIRRPARAEPPCPRDFTIVHADARVIVVDKPAGLPVHASAKFYFNTLARVLAERYPDEPELQICHRLDRETSGCLVVARDRDAAAFVKTAIADKDRATKQYLAVVDGEPPWDADDARRAAARGWRSRCDEAARRARARRCGWLAGRHARRRRAAHPPRASASPAMRRSNERARRGRARSCAARSSPAASTRSARTSRTPGCRSSATSCTAPAKTPSSRTARTATRSRFELPRHALHAARVELPHPDGGTIVAEAPLPADLAALVE